MSYSGFAESEMKSCTAYLHGGGCLGASEKRVILSTCRTAPTELEYGIMHLLTSDFRLLGTYHCHDLPIGTLLEQIHLHCRE